ncbi:hypothetical protein H6G45_00130 [Synechocystis sp. FACHB-383]|uniref:hypothetical protein n=1 Tax=Synechocystis sp. FACHB-383 TaxID=2692864 RepID=UPI00168A39D6|nr:hypothetical protein [Synechocystis sp. FACHB-383]MBD2651919.1 hypothetical protein [Synechocystis sp. FACHB-383]
MVDNDFSRQPWASGPAEILQHGLSLLSNKDSDKNRRLAIISIDNAVELMIKTYLNLPSRITGLKISRKDYSEFSESFPRLLDALETNADDKLEGIDLGEVEWYHRLRNELYHQGNGLTVERKKVEIYAELAKILFNNLYGIELITDNRHAVDRLSLFMNTWVEVERRLHSTLAQGSAPFSRALMDGVKQLMATDVLNNSDYADFQQLYQIRNRLVHGQLDIEKTITPDIIKRLQAFLQKLPTRTSDS